MSLTGQQMPDLAAAFSAEWGLPQLTQFAARFAVNLENLAPDGSVKDRAYKFILHMNGSNPSRDRELLEELSLHGNAALKRLAAELLKPTYYSPTGNPHDAILLGRTAFIARTELRTLLRDFTNFSNFTTRVLIVRGDRPCGKSYSWELIRHLAVSVNALPQRLNLKAKNYTPKQILEQVALLTQLNRATLPPLADDPQFSRIDPLLNWFKGMLSSLPRPYWLVIDDLNDPSVTPAMREMAYALAYCVEETKTNNLWIMLLGYNELITEPEFRITAQEDAQFPDAPAITRHFEDVAQVSPEPLTSGRAKKFTDLLLSMFSPPNKENMIKLTVAVEKVDELLRLGQIKEPKFLSTAQGVSEFPDAAAVARHFEDVAQRSRKPLTPGRAQEIADLLFSKFPLLDKDNKNNLIDQLDTMEIMLRLGHQP